MDHRKVLAAAGIICVIIIMFTLVLMNLFGPSAGLAGENSRPQPVMASTNTTYATTTTESLPPSDATIYFGTHGDGIHAYSEATDSIRHFRNTTEDVEGVAYDARSNMLYYCTYDAIHRVGMDGKSDEQIVLPLSQSQYGGTVWGIAFDWITGNFYGVSYSGYVFACKTAPGVTLNCRNLLTGQGQLHGLALNPNRGIMYWSKDYNQIAKADMDGSNVTIIVHERVANGLTIDYVTLRLYWAADNNGIKSSDPDGGDVQLIVQLSLLPWGLAASSQRIYWGFYGAGNSLHSSTKDGQDRKALFHGTKAIQHLTVIEESLPVTRRNDCEGQVCSGICVLNPISFRCVT